MTESTTVGARLVTGPVGSGLLRLTAPMILGISSNLVAGLLEAWFIGRIGTVELAAYSFTFPVVGALMSVSLGTSIGLSSVLARTVGRGDQLQIRRLATDGIGLAATIMAVVALVGWMTIDPLFDALGADSTTLPLVHGYMSVWYVSVVFMTVPSVGANALRATGDARISGTIMVAGAVLQMALDPFLIFGLAGLPALGLMGAAIANLVARVVLFVVTMYILYSRESLIDFESISPARVMASWRRILMVSIPATATNLIGPVSTAIIVRLLSGFSQETVAGFGIASRIEGMFVIPLFALSASIGPFVGQNWGKEEYGRANKAMLLSYYYSIGWGVAVALLLFFSRQLLVRQFDANEQVIEAAGLYLAIVPLSYGTWGVLMMTNAIFNSLGKPISATILSIVRMLVINVPLAFLGKAVFGLPGIFMAACISNLSMGTLGYLWNRRTFLPVILGLRETA